MTTGIICAMEIEAQLLIKELTKKETVLLGSTPFHCGYICDKKVIIAVCGEGKVASACNTQRMIDKFNPDIIINTGVGGGLNSSFKVCDITIADYVVQHDIDETPLGYELGFINCLELIKIPVEPKIKDCLHKSCMACHNINTYIGTIASGDQFITTKERKEFIVKTFGAITVDMESAAIGQVCRMNSIPFGVIRAISDGANEDSHLDFRKFLEKASVNSIKIIKKFLELFEIN